MAVNKAVHKLDKDLSRLKKLGNEEKSERAKEAKAKTTEKNTRSQISTQEKSIVDQFAAGTMTPAQIQTAAQQLFGLGEKDQKAVDAFNKTMGADKADLAKLKGDAKAAHKTALKDLKPAEYHLGLKATNRDRKDLGLKALKKPLREAGNKEPWKRGPGTEYGADTSAYQSDAQFQASIKGKPFAALKATDGTSANQADFKSRWNEMGKLVKSGKMKLRIAYHFLEPGESGVAQAKKFLDTVGIHGKLHAGTRLALDWEKNLNGVLPSTSVLRDAANYIHKVTGAWPLIYSQGSLGGAAHAAVPHAPQWLAGVADSSGDPLAVSERNRNVPFFQYSWKPWDLDQFNGNMKALEKFAGWS